jgi:hypothetical protein
MNSIPENAVVVNGGDTPSTLTRAWDLPSPTPRNWRQPTTNQISTVARRNLTDSAILASRTIGSRRRIDTERVADEIHHGIEELDGPSLHALWLVFHALRRANRRTPV